MTHTIRTLIACVIPLALGACSPRTPGAVAPAPGATTLSRMEGRWRGTLQYRDYRDSTRRVTLPTRLLVSGAADGAEAVLHFVYDDGPGKTVVEDDRLRLDDRLPNATWRSGNDHVQQYVVRSRSHDMDDRSVVLEGEGEDDNRKAMIRETIVVDASTLRILKEVRFGSAFEFRHEYRFVRVE